MMVDSNKQNVTKGIILAGGSGSRLSPLTSILCKQLLPVYDKPLIYYPLSTLMLFGIRDILIISTPKDLPHLKNLFGDGHSLGLSLSYKEQPAPDGIAEAFLIGRDFIGDDPVALILGDNIFYGISQFETEVKKFCSGGLVFGYFMKDPKRYGVIEFDTGSKPIKIIEKPINPPSNYAVTGLYLYDSKVVGIAEKLKPSQRGELEISDLNNAYLELSELKVITMDRGIGWLDAGTFESLLEAGNYIATIEKRQGLKIGCVEEVAYRKEFIDQTMLKALINNMPSNSYRAYLEDIIRNDHGGE